MGAELQPGKQLNLLKNIGFNDPSWEDLGKLLAGLLVLATLGRRRLGAVERLQHGPLAAPARRRPAQAEARRDKSA